MEELQPQPQAAATESRGSATKARWATSALIAAAIMEVVPRDDPAFVEVDKFIVYNRSLYTAAKRLGLIERIIAKDRDAVYELLATDEWGRVQGKPSLRTVSEDNPPTREGQEDRKYVINAKGQKMYETDILRLALWFVGMCGGNPKIAKRAIIAAAGSKGILDDD